jgi:hypothetical protein
VLNRTSVTVKHHFQLPSNPSIKSALLSNYKIISHSEEHITSIFNMSLRTTAATRFDKQIRDHEVEVAVLVPKDLKPGKHPLYVKWHGGGLVSIKIPSSHMPSHH